MNLSHRIYVRNNFLLEVLSAVWCWRLFCRCKVTCYPTNHYEWVLGSVSRDSYLWKFLALILISEVEFPDRNISGFSSVQPVQSWNGALKRVKALSLLRLGQHSIQSSAKYKTEDLPLGLKYSDVPHLRISNSRTPYNDIGLCVTLPIASDIL